VVQLASDMDSNLIFVECECKPETIQSRLKEREKFNGLSDARIQHLPDIINHFEPITEFDPHAHIKVKTDASIDKLSTGFSQRRIYANRPRLKTAFESII
jgi:predicted kinase